MIKKNELRIGNYVNLEVSNGVETVCLSNGIITELTNDRLRVNDIVFDYKDLRPIQITNEWLEKSGKLFLFRFQTCWRGKFAYLKINGCNFMWFSDTNTIEVDGGEHILHFIHEYQNLFFCLTGEDLVFSSTEP